MKAGYTHISFILDQSGSMSSVKGDTISGFNNFIETHKKAPGDATMSLYTFNSSCRRLYVFENIQQVAPLNTSTFRPDDTTALLDAMGLVINETGKQLSELAEEHRPEKVLIVILTDGEENSSQQFNMNQINDLIAHQTEVYSWEFIYLGANQDAIATAARMGIRADNSLTYSSTPDGVQRAFSSLADATLRARHHVGRFAWSEEERKNNQASNNS
jgi:hypothetical protein